MKKENRLLKNRDFKSVLDKNKSVSCGELIIYFKKNTLNKARIGISVSSKIGNSVIRHKVKRQISEMIKVVFDMRKSMDLVIIVRKKFLDNCYSKNQTNLNRLIEKLLKGDKE